MTHKVYVGIGLLMILSIGIAVFLLNHNVDNEPEVIYSGKVVDSKGKELPPAKPGFEWVQHEDHFHEVRVSEQNVPTDTVSDKTPLPSEPVGDGEPMPSVVPPNYPNPDNPVAALREYLSKRGHWSAEWIPDFPVEDTEAAKLAHNVLIMLVHEDAGNKILDGAAGIAAEEYLQIQADYRKEIIEIVKSQRMLQYPPAGDDIRKRFQRLLDLSKFNWVFLDASDVNPEERNW